MRKVLSPYSQLSDPKIRLTNPLSQKVHLNNIVFSHDGLNLSKVASDTRE
jgi:hypothetical protein